MYTLVLVTHSWLRYLVLGFGIGLLIASFLSWRNARETSPQDERLHVRFLAALDAQLLLGLLLYFVLSPITEAAFANFGAAMKNAQLRFFGVEHIATMLLAVIVAHVGRNRSKRKHGAARHRTVFITQAVWLVLTLAAIPWPMLDTGRPLFRL